MSSSEKNICIVSVNRSAYSETFIRAHIERLPAKVHLLYGGYMPIYNPEGKLLLNNPLYNFLPQLIFKVAKKRNFSAIENYLKDNKIEAVLCEYGPCGVEMIDICRKMKTPLFIYFHGYDIYRKNELSKYQKRYKELFEIASGIFVVSRDMQNCVIEMGASKDKLIYNPCGADTDLFFHDDSSENSKTFFAAGRFEETKCPQNTIKAFAIAAEKFPDSKLIFAGDGKLLNECKTLAQELRIEEKIEFTGVLSHEEIAQKMRTSIAFVQHSVTTDNGDKEGTPVAIMEAGASALPVITTRHGGIPDVVIDGVTGFLVEEHDVNAMAEKMIRLLSEPGLASKMGNAAAERVRENFSQSKSLNVLWAIIEREINQKNQ